MICLIKKSSSDLYKFKEILFCISTLLPPVHRNLWRMKERKQHDNKILISINMCTGIQLASFRFSAFLQLKYHFTIRHTRWNDYDTKSCYWMVKFSEVIEQIDQSRYNFLEILIEILFMDCNAQHISTHTHS